jgi:carbon storage regulator
MLVLSRKKGEAIVVDTKTLITVVEIHGNKVVLGIEAPAEVPVHRREVTEAIQREEQDDDPNSDAA